MADFCKQCSVGLGAPEGWTDMPQLTAGFTLAAICEGCQDSAETTVMNADGECIGLTNGQPCAAGHARDGGNTDG